MLCCLPFPCSRRRGSLTTDNELQTTSRAEAAPAAPPPHTTTAPELKVTKQYNQHPISFIPEILEIILHHTDIRTVLTSAQRVCKSWHELITTSTALQVYLFFKPAPANPHTKRIRNPLIETVLWPHFYRKRPHSQQAQRQRHHAYRKLTRLPTINLDTEDAFLRPEASWRNMLLQQPPSSRIGIIQVDGPTESSDFTGITVTVQKEVNNSYKDEYIRMEYIDSGIARGVLLPSQDAWIFWGGWITERPHRTERNYRHEREVAGERYLGTGGMDGEGEGVCAVVIIASHCSLLLERAITELDQWIDALGEWNLVRGRFHLRIWDD